jgi:hypothetical protein
MKVPKQCVHRRRPIARAPTNRIAAPLYPGQPSPTRTHSDSIAVDQSGAGSRVIPEHWPSPRSQRLAALLGLAEF